MSILFGDVVGLVAWFPIRHLAASIYTANQNERAVRTSFGRAERIGQATALDGLIAKHLKPEERDRLRYPQMRVVPPGGPHFKWP